MDGLENIGDVEASSRFLITWDCDDNVTEVQMNAGIVTNLAPILNYTIY
jgi:hypothetical protein